MGTNLGENEVRKDFSKSERICYARRLEKIEALKAKDRMIATQNNYSARAARENFPQLVNGKSQDTVNLKVCHLLPEFLKSCNQTFGYFCLKDRLRQFQRLR